jgi:hypothetical protein
MNKYLEKVAKDIVEKSSKKSKSKKEGLQEHQSRSVEKLLANKGLLLSHGTGSGKTRTINEAVKRIQALDKDKKQLIITPASLTSNIEKDHKKHGIKVDEKRMETISYEKALNDIQRLMKNDYSLIAMDEGHKLRNTDTKRFKNLEALIAKAEHRLIATATPIYNSPEDISPLVNLISGDKDLLPTDKKKFAEKYISSETTKPGLVSQFLFGKKPETTVKIKNKSELSGALNKYVDHYDVKDDPDSAKFFPKKEFETHEVHMSSDQERMYKYLENDIPFIIRMKIRNNLPLDKKESAQLNAFATGVRQVSNSTKPYNKGGSELSPKIQKAADELQAHMKKDKNFRGVVYSNYLRAGLNDYSEHLTSKGVKHTVYHGGLSRKEKDQAVLDYNSGKVPTLLISSSGAEGLDLKGTKLMQVLEPHFNKSKIDQVVGRGARYKSHEHLPEEERNVKIQHFHSVFKPGMFGGKSKNKSIDQYLSQNSDGKDQITSKIKELIQSK